jgi:riboflavin synthase
MFTGIIHHQGFFKGYLAAKKALVVEVPSSFPHLEVGESVAVNGVCLSLLRQEGRRLSFHLSQETLAKTTFRLLRGGEKLNLELPLTLQAPVSGHLVSGHIDGLGRVLRVVARHPGRRLTISFPRELQPYFVPKGSVAVNGVSLTVVDIRPTSFDIELIPLTIAESNLQDLKPGATVNLECDIIGKYVYNWLSKGKNTS